MSIIERLKNSFIRDKVAINTPSSILEVREFEKKYGVKCPDILKEYFLSFNGSGCGNFGANGFAFFSLLEFKPVNEDLGIDSNDQEIYRDYFVFSDYLVWCWGYAVKLDNKGSDGPVVQVADTTVLPRKMANSFSEFIEIYLSNSDHLF